MPSFRQIGLNCIKFFESVVLIIIAFATIFAIGQEMISIFRVGSVSLADLLLMFIYLEVFAMVANYAEYGKLPVRMPIYIGIIALARYLILDMKSMDDLRIFGIAVTILVLAISVVVIRWGQIKLPYKKRWNQDSE